MPAAHIIIPSLLAMMLLLWLAIWDWRGRRSSDAVHVGTFAAVLAVAVLVVFMPSGAFAQDAIPVSAESWADLLFKGCAAVLTLVIAYVLHRWLGIQLGQKAQDDLHRAIETGAKAVAARSGLDSAVDKKIEGVIAYANLSVPGAFKRLAPPADVLREIASAKLGEALGQIAPLPRS